MDNYARYAIAINSPSAKAHADALNLNPNTYNYTSLTDPDYNVYYMWIVIDLDDDYVLYANPITEEKLNEWMTEFDVTVYTD